MQAEIAKLKTEDVTSNFYEKNFSKTWKNE